MRRLLFITALSLHASVASAQLVVAAPAVESQLGIEIALLNSQIAKEIKQIAELKLLVDNLRQVLKTSNQIAALTRSAKRMYDVARRYSLRDYIRDAKEGFYRAWPELRQLDKELQLADRNVRGIDDGTFTALWDYHDPNAQRALTSAASYAFRASVYPLLLDDVDSYEPLVSSAEKLAQHHFRTLGFGTRRALQTAGSSALSKKLGHLLKEAEGKQRIDFGLLGVSATAEVQTMDNTQLLRDAKELELAEEQKRRLRKKQRDEQLNDVITQEGPDLFEIGVIR